ncbi:hypothetical protein HOY82DRAFT_645498 [Tuber indicum]|nr:hypothetical protein HOY82DRAFT_645498 [Tuber indicum]
MLSPAEATSNTLAPLSGQSKNRSRTIHNHHLVPTRLPYAKSALKLVPESSLFECRTFNVRLANCERLDLPCATELRWVDRTLTGTCALLRLSGNSSLTRAWELRLPLTRETVPLSLALRAVSGGVFADVDHRAGGNHLFDVIPVNESFGELCLTSIREGGGQGGEDTGGSAEHSRLHSDDWFGPVSALVEKLAARSGRPRRV